MATTTPNFGWDVPQSTDLVKDGATAIAALGNDIDTSLVDLKGGTTGQVLSKASNTDMDFTWVAQDDSNAIQNAIVDAKGDLISATAADTPARLAVGTDGQVLTADSTQSTGLKWATPASATTYTLRFAGSNTLLYRVAYNGSNMYVAVGDAGSLYSSPDGITWTSRTSGFGANLIYSVAFGNGLFVAVGGNGTISTSSDGITWTARTANMGTNLIRSVIYANSLWVAVGNGGGTTNTGGITYSSDGITWTRKSQSLTIGGTYYSVAWNGTNWIVGATSSTNNFLYASTPSGTWTAAADSSGGTIVNIWWDGTRHIYHTNLGAAYYSTSTTMATQTQINGMVCSDSNHYRTTYFSNKIYVLGAVVVEYSTTPGTNNVAQTSAMPYIAPATRNTETSALSATDNWSINVFSTGTIITTQDGRIYTSF